LYGGARSEAVEGSPIELLPRVGARWEWSSELALSMALGRSLRVPTIDELHHPREAGFSGNPSLVPETAWEAELSLRAELLEGIGVGAAAFARQIDSLILYINHDAFLIRPENVGAAKTGGAEVELRARSSIGGCAVRSDLAAGVLASELVATGEPLPTAPALTFDAEVELALGLVPEEAPAALYTRFRYASSTAANLEATLTTRPYARWDAGVSVRPASGAVFSVVVTNLTDDRSLETVHKIPLPGRAVLATLLVRSGER
jgi:outer membrane receptor protein involved in Fe transport